MRVPAARRNACLEVTDAYREQLRLHMGLPPGALPECTLEDATTWGMAQGLLEMHPDEAFHYLLAQMSEANRGDTAVVRGRRRRKRYCIRADVEDGPETPEEPQPPQQRTLWGDVYHSSRAFLVRALEQQRAEVQRDVDAYEANAAFVSEALVGRGLAPLAQGLLRFWPVP